MKPSARRKQAGQVERAVIVAPLAAGLAREGHLPWVYSSAAFTVASPMPPHPTTATVEPGSTLAVCATAP